MNTLARLPGDGNGAVGIFLFDVVWHTSKIKIKWNHEYPTRNIEFWSLNSSLDIPCWVFDIFPPLPYSILRFRYSQSIFINFIYLYS
jgi:hypothetical protein